MVMHTIHIEDLLQNNNNKSTNRNYIQKNINVRKKRTEIRSAYRIRRKKKIE